MEQHQFAKLSKVGDKKMWELKVTLGNLECGHSDGFMERPRLVCGLGFILRAQATVQGFELTPDQVYT